MILAAICRAECGAVTALVADIDVTTACGITCGRTWSVIQRHPQTPEPSSGWSE
jgi:hypothetical protein